MNPNVLSVIIYGSHARKDHDCASDLDICVLTDGKISIEEIKNDILHLIPSHYQNSVEITSYSSDLVQSMLEYGSLFMWHLKMEGKVVYGKQYFTKIIQSLSRYDHHKEELEYHFQILNDLKKAQILVNVPNEFDLSILFTICRNTCMILSNKYNTQEFGRLSCFQAANNLFKDLPLRKETYLYLSSWKNVYERGQHTQHNLPQLKEFTSLINETEILVKYAIERIPNDN